MENKILEKAANNYFNSLNEDDFKRNLYIKLFKAGAKFQKEQDLGEIDRLSHNLE